MVVKHPPRVIQGSNQVFLVFEGEQTGSVLDPETECFSNLRLVRGPSVDPQRILNLEEVLVVRLPFRGEQVAGVQIGRDDTAAVEASQFDVDVVHNVHDEFDQHEADEGGQDLTAEAYLLFFGQDPIFVEECSLLSHFCFFFGNKTYQWFKSGSVCV